jgi:phosphatidate cytidylyltransferase
MKNIIIRTISGIIYIALIVGALYQGDWLWFALTALFTIISTLEYQRIQDIKNGEKLNIFNRALDMTAALLVWAIGPIYHYYNFYAALFLIAPLFLYFLVRMISSIFQKQGPAISSVATSIFGVLYIALPLSMLNVFAASFKPIAASAILWMFALIWINDTGAFCVGSMFGKHRLCERLSPKKSWEGFWGGMLFCIIASVIFALTMKCPMHISIILGIMVSILATLGDLFESMLKRSAGVKDAGNIIPGHGGVLDRIDSLLFVAPFATSWAIFLLI